MIPQGHCSFSGLKVQDLLRVAEVKWREECGCWAFFDMAFFQDHIKGLRVCEPQVELRFLCLCGAWLFPGFLDEPDPQQDHRN